MNYLLLSTVILLSCNSNERSSKKHVQDANRDIVRPKSVCVDTALFKVKSGFYLLIPNPGKTSGIQLAYKGESFSLDSTRFINLVDVDTAYKVAQNNGYFRLEFRFNKGGTRRWAVFTSENVNQKIGLVLCNRLISVVTVFEPILFGTSAINTNYTESEAEDLKNVFKAEIIKANQEYINNNR